MPILPTSIVCCSRCPSSASHQPARLAEQPLVRVALEGANYTYLLDELGYEEVSMAGKSGGSCDPQRRLDPDDI